jgi:hypothetical protein
MIVVAVGRGVSEAGVERGMAVTGKHADAPIFRHDVGGFGGQGEHDVEVADQQQVGLTLGELCSCRRTLALRAMPVAAGVIGDAPLAAVLAGSI